MAPTIKECEQSYETYHQEMPLMELWSPITTLQKPRIQANNSALKNACLNGLHVPVDPAPIALRRVVIIPQHRSATAWINELYVRRTSSAGAAAKTRAREVVVRRHVGQHDRVANGNATIVVIPACRNAHHEAVAAVHNRSTCAHDCHLRAPAPKRRTALSLCQTGCALGTF